MSAVFTLPRQIPLSAGAILPGAKLTFSQTGTSTLQNTYQDQARTTPHANPVVADSNGVFATIYLDPTLPNYRVKLTTSANVLVYQEDDYPSNQNTQQSQRLESTNPFIIWYDTDGTANSRKYRARVSGADWLLETLNDAEDTASTVLSVKKTPTPRVVLGSNATVDTGSTEYSVAYVISGTFTGTFTGMVSTTTLSVSYQKIGSIVHLYVPAGTTGTSNSTNFSMTGLPALLTPTSTKNIACANVYDNGSLLASLATVTGLSGTITFSLYRTGSIANRVDYSNNIFTNSGNKGIGDGWSITYAV